MPPLIGIDRGIDGTALKAFEELGHGTQIVIVDPSYPIPKGAEVVNYHGNDSAQALRGILNLVPSEMIDVEHTVLCMRADEPAETCDATVAFEGVAQDLGFVLGYEPRKGVPGSKLFKGFYKEAEDPERTTLFVRTRDRRAFACARFIVGHSQD